MSDTRTANIQSREPVSGQKSQSHLDEIIEAMPVPIAMANANGTVIGVNSGFLQAFGLYSGDGFVGEFNLFSDPIVRALQVPNLEQRVCSGEVVVLPGVMISATRMGHSSRPHKYTILTIEMTLVPVRFFGTFKIMTVWKDLTESKEREAAYTTQKEHLAITLGSVGDGVIITDTNGKIMLINAAAEQLTGWTSEEAIYQPIEMVNVVITVEHNSKI